MKKLAALTLCLCVLLSALPDSALAEAQFEDVPSDAWYAKAVEYVQGNGLMSGIDDGIFAPDGSMTRAQLITILWRMNGKRIVEADMPFDDIEADEWYTEAVRWGVSEQIVSGVSKTEFAPARAVTREELAAMLYRNVQKQGRGFVGTWVFPLEYDDADSISEWAFEPVCWMIMNGIITGTDENLLLPKSGATRAQTASIIMRFEHSPAPYYDRGEDDSIVTIKVNTKGYGGQIDVCEGGEEIEFDDEYPVQSAVMNVARNSKLKLGAKADEGTKFMKWTLDGKDYSKDEIIEVDAKEDAEYIAVFGFKGRDGTYVDLEAVTTLGELLGLPDYATSASDGEYVYVFEQDGIFYRATADMPDSVLDAVVKLDFDDAEYEEKLDALISPLAVVEIENLTEKIPSQEELDTLIGKSCAELMYNDWYYYGINLYDNALYMEHGPFSYTVYFDGEVANADDFNEETDMDNLTVKSVVYEGIGDASRK